MSRRFSGASWSGVSFRCPGANGIDSLVMEHLTMFLARLEEFVGHFFTDWFAVIQIVGLMTLIGFALEQIKPVGQRVPISAMLFNLAYVAISFAVLVTLVPWLQVFTNPIVQRWGGCLHMRFPDGLLGSILSVAVFLLIYDFFYYWWHRAQHATSWLWAVHELHHTERHLNVTTSARHHWLEESFRLFAVLLPMGLLFRLDGPSIGAVFTVAMFFGYFIHLNLRLELGVFTGLVGGPQYHRLHHSIENQHHNRNFAALFPIWDRVFHTQRLPLPSEWPETGLVEYPVGNSWKHALFGPFIAWASTLRLHLRLNGKHRAQVSARPE